jgi:hypothetical protein
MTENLLPAFNGRFNLRAVYTFSRDEVGCIERDKGLLTWSGVPIP